MNRKLLTVAGAGVFALLFALVSHVFTIDQNIAKNAQLDRDEHARLWTALDGKGEFSSDLALSPSTRLRLSLSPANVTVFDDIKVNNTIVDLGTLAVTGNVSVNTNKFNITAANGNTTVAGTLGVTSDLSVNTNKFNVTAASGNTAVAGAIDFSGVISPANLTGTPVNDYNPAGLSTTRAIRQNESANATITGLVAQPDGTEIVIMNVSATLMITLTNQDAGSAAANRFLLYNSSNYAIPPLGGVTLRYSGADSRWRLASSVDNQPTLAGTTYLAGSTIDATTSRVNTGALAVTQATTTAITGTLNDWNPTYTGGENGSFVTIVRANTSGATTITGRVAAAFGGRQQYIQNVGVANITITNQDAGSAAANRFITPSGTSITIVPGGVMHFYYDIVLARWIVDYVSTSASATGTTNTIAAFTSGSTLGNSLAPLTDDGTTFAVNTNKFTVTEANGNTSVAGTLGSTGNFAVNTNKFTVTASNGNTLAAGTLSSTSDFAVNTNQFTVTASNGNTTAAGTLTADGGNRVFDLAGTGLVRDATPNQIDLSINGGATQTCPAGQAVTSMTTTGIQSCSAFSGAGAVTGTGTANTLTKWTGPSAVGDSATTDNGTTFAIATNKFTVTEANGNTAVAGTLNVTGSSTLAATSATEVDATGSVSATATSGSVNNWDPTGGGNLAGIFIVRDSPSAATTITGLVAGNSGQLIDIRNTSATAANTITITNEDGGSTAANRFTLANAASAEIMPGGSCTFRYSGTASRWEAIDNCQSTMTTIANSTITVTDTGTQNDYNPTGLGATTTILFNSGGTATINGLVGGQDGRLINICNLTTNNVTLAAEAAGSTAANRFDFAVQNNIVLAGAGTNKYACVQLIYLSSVSRWTQLSMAGTSSIVQPITFSGLITASNGITISSASFTFSGGGHINVSGGTAPTLSSCGTSPTIHGSDNAGRITTGTTNTGCTVTFASTFTNVPACICSTENVDSTFKCVPTATTLTITYASNSNNIFDYTCWKVQ